MQFKQLDVWKRSSRLSVKVYRYSPQIKDFGFRDQLTRSILSVASNIAEGEDRDSIKDSIRYLNMAKGSSAEAITQIFIGIEANFIDRNVGFDWLGELEQINKMIAGLIKFKKLSLQQR